MHLNMRSVQPDEGSRRACLHELFEVQARRTPDAVAVVLGLNSLTYGELDASANQLARHLTRLGACRESLIGLCVDRSLEMVIAILGILKTGAAYVPLDPSYPRDRLVFVLSDTRTTLLITQKLHLDKLSDIRALKVICIDQDWSMISKESRHRFPSDSKPGDLAYVIYTSGSTGHPKGVMIEHRSVCNVLTWLQQNYPLTPDDVVIQRISFAFDGSVCDFYWPFLAGARLAMLRPDRERDPDYLAQVLEEVGGTVITLVPSMLANLLAFPSTHLKLRSLRRVFCGGETLSPDLVNRCFATVGPNLELVNLYGPTEATVFVSAWRCNGAQFGGRVPIGWPINDTQLHIAGDSTQSTSADESGELLIGGAGLARGYLNQPAITAERFVPNPNGPPGTRLYRTGDIVKRSPGGALELLGRSDSQVKLRGFRIELGEIQACLAEQRGVRDAVVMLRSDESGSDMIVGYVATDDHTVVEDTLMTSVKRRLPDHMVPTRIMILDNLPVTAHGKVDRQALPAPPALQDDVHYKAPQSNLEKLVILILEEHLGVERIGVNDHFFRLGMNSLKAVEFAHTLGDALGVKVNVATMLSHDSVVALIAAVAPGSHERATLEGKAAEVLEDHASASDEIGQFARE